MNQSIKDLIQLKQLIEQLNQTTSGNAKKTLLLLNSEIKKLLYYTHFDMWKYNITSKTLKKNKNIVKDVKPYDDFYQLLNDLRDRVITGHNAIFAVNDFCSRHEDLEETIYLVVDRNLKCRVGTSLINQVWDKFIPVFNVQLAYDIKKHEKYVNFEKQSWYASRKLDGCRVIVKKINNIVRFFSREGHEFFTLNNLIDPVLSIYENDFILDCEVCLIDKYGKENFTAIVSEIKKKEHIIDNPVLFIFDILTVEEFESEKSKAIFSERIFDRSKSFSLSNESITILSQIPVLNKHNLEIMKETARKMGWEGLILREDVKYKGRRSKHILKIKDFIDAEFQVINVVNGPMRYCIKQLDGSLKEVEEEMVVSVVIKYKGGTVNVGSGFSIDQRKMFYKNPELIVDKEITIQYFEESQNKKGVESMRFPTFKYLYEGKRDI